MSEEYKKRLYDYFLKDTPLQFESVTEDQWKQMSETTAGASIALSLAWKNIVEAIVPPFEAAVKALNEAFKNIGRKQK